MKGRYENSTIKLVFKSCQTFAEYYFKKLMFQQNWNFFMCLQVRRQLSISKKNFLVIHIDLIWQFFLLTANLSLVL